MIILYANLTKYAERYLYRLILSSKYLDEDDVEIWVDILYGTYIICLKCFLINM